MANLLILEIRDIGSVRKKSVGQLRLFNLMMKKAADELGNI
jgi:hypothetical protein